MLYFHDLFFFLNKQLIDHFHKTVGDFLNFFQAFFLFILLNELVFFLFFQPIISVTPDITDRHFIIFTDFFAEFAHCPQFGKGCTPERLLEIPTIASVKEASGNLAQVWDGGVQLLDCDVEAPNAHLFLQARPGDVQVVNIPIPQVDGALCDGCGECGQLCEFNAIVALQTTAMVFPELCHGCGGCVKVCPRQALREVDHRIGEIEMLEEDNVAVVQGRLDVGVAAAPPLIRAVKARRRNHGTVILDAPPGTSCPMVAAVRGADFVILVTEPTPFGLHDLELAVETVKQLNIPFGVVVNRHGVGDDRVHVFCRQRDIPILLEIPDDRRIAEAYSRGDLVVEALPEYRGLFRGLMDKIARLSLTSGDAVE